MLIIEFKNFLAHAPFFEECGAVSVRSLSSEAPSGAKEDGITIQSRRAFSLRSEKRLRGRDAAESRGRASGFTGRYMLEYPRMAHYLTKYIC